MCLQTASRAAGSLIDHPREAAGLEGINLEHNPASSATFSLSENCILPTEAIKMPAS